VSTFWKGPARNDMRYKRVRKAVLERDGWRCQIQRKGCLGQATQAHHVDGVSAGNLHDSTRMVAACQPCNASVGRPAGDPPLVVRAWW
jgi:5-methylcytosine-specific restriction endonuclease McrA